MLLQCKYVAFDSTPFYGKKGRIGEPLKDIVVNWKRRWKQFFSFILYKYKNDIFDYIITKFLQI